MLKNLTTGAGSNSVEYSVSKSEGEQIEIAHGFSFELSVVGGFGIGGASAKAGGYVSLDYMNGHSVSKSHGEGTKFGGKVMGLDGKDMQANGLDPNAWSFNWQLATWDSNLKDNAENSRGYVPVIGYVLSSVKAPSMPVENLKVQFERSSESDELCFDLSWDCGNTADTLRTRTAGYRVYLYDIAGDTFKLIDTINDAQTTSYTYKNHYNGSEYYRFMVKAFSAPTVNAPSLESAPRFATYYMSTAASTILSIEKSGSEGLNDIYTIRFVDGTTQTFTVSNGNGISSVELVSSDAASGIDTYKISFTDGCSTTFTVKNGEKGDRGDTGVGVERIEKLRSDGNLDIYAVYLTDGTFYTFTVTNGKDGTNGANGVDGKDGVGISDIRIDENGNFIFTMSDGSQISSGSVPENTQQLSQAQADIAELRQQLQDQESNRNLAIGALALAGISLLWQIIALILALTRSKKEYYENSGVS